MLAQDQNIQFIRLEDQTKRKNIILKWCHITTTVIVSLLAIIFFALYIREIQHSNNSPTIELDSSTKYFLETLDRSIDPCDDFHAFVCSNWESKFQNVSTDRIM